jgi:hypothetical protein
MSIPSSTSPLAARSLALGGYLSIVGVVPVIRFGVPVSVIGGGQPTG